MRPLSAGLDIVRKCLGQHEIATVQTTAIDREAGLVQLTTVLAHSSGEWMSSDWPVCPVTETGAPHRMGAALTYARRYALFTLVGIAGEDDLDAPDLPTLVSKGGNAAPLSNGQSHTGNGRAGPAVTSPVAVGSGRQRGKAHGAAAKPVLAAEASAARREELLTEIAALASIDQIDAWALRGLPAKNTLQTTDAQLIEDAFGKKLTELVPLSERRSEDSGAQTPLQSEAISQSSVAAGAPALAAAQALDFEHYAVTPKPRRLRDKRHREFVAAQPCVVCGRQPSTPTICASPSPGRSAVKSAMSSRCRSAGRIIVRCIGPAKSRNGGQNWTLNRWLWPTNFGRKPTPASRDRGLDGQKPAHRSSGPTAVAPAATEPRDIKAKRTQLLS